MSKALKEFVESSEDPMVKKILRVGLGGISTVELKELGDYLDEERKKWRREKKKMIRMMRGVR